MKKYKDKDGAYLVVWSHSIPRIGSAYCLQWMFPDDEGGLFGECEYDEPVEKAGYDACLKMIAELEPKQLAGRKPWFWFERLSDAKSALALTNATMLAAQENKEWPEWASTAVANGWKAPKGWKP
jgi:hypothetical protein